RIAELIGALARVAKEQCTAGAADDLERRVLRERHAIVQPFRWRVAAQPTHVESPELLDFVADVIARGDERVLTAEARGAVGDLGACHARVRGTCRAVVPSDTETRRDRSGGMLATRTQREHAARQ